MREITGTKFHNTTMFIDNTLIIQMLYEHSDKAKGNLEIDFNIYFIF